jgi:hypothetical protein
MAEAPKNKARTLEWSPAESSAEEVRWEGRIDGRVLATVTDWTASGSSVFYDLPLGELGGGAIRVSSVEAGKKAAQRALNKVVKFLAGEA